MKINKLILVTILTFGLIIKLNSQTTDFDNKPIVFTDNSLGINFFIGNGIYTSNISEYFSNPFYVGLNLDYYKNRIVIQFDDFTLN